jgi:predicted nuclease of predicted toxin-antitoxin system
VAKLLADENVALDIVTALRTGGHDVTSIKDVGPGSTDVAVLARALAEDRVLLTFDKDFGELAFHLGQSASPGIILLRPRLRSPAYLVRFTLAVLGQDQTWQGHFTVAEDGRLRMVPLP